MPQPLYPKEQTPHHSLRCWVHCRAGRVALEKINICLPLPQPRFLSHSMHSLDQTCPTCNLQSYMMCSVTVKLLNFSIFKFSTLKNLHMKNNDTGIWIIHCGANCQVGYKMWPAACFQSDKTGLGIMLTKQLQLPVIPCSFRKHKQKNSMKEW